MVSVLGMYALLLPLTPRNLLKQMTHYLHLKNRKYSFKCKTKKTLGNHLSLQFHVSGANVMLTRLQAFRHTITKTCKEFTPRGDCLEELKSDNCNDCEIAV